MIRKIKFSNFYSFNEEQEISFLTNKKQTFDYVHSEVNKKEQILKIAGFVGGNASGKTNVMRCLSFFYDFIISNKRENTLSVPYKTFFNNKRKSSFSIEFEIKNRIFFYSFNIKNQIIINESLQVKDSKKGSRVNSVFIRESSLKDNKVKSDFKFNRKFFPKQLSEVDVNIIRPDVSLVAFLKIKFSIDIIDEISNYFLNTKTNITETGELNNPMRQINALKYYLEDKEGKKEMEDFISKFDLGIKEFNIKETIIKKDLQGQELRFDLSAIHNTSELNNGLDWNYESAGTRTLFFSFANILWALKHDSLIIIDELERDLHPEAFNKIISYFINKNYKGRAQLIFSSHSLDFMKKFDSQQIFLVDKNEKSESEVYRLDGVNKRSDVNLYAKYMTGAYGAFPKIKT